ncbi:MAG: hypothetical protein ACRD82_24165 [Blastocatellia bacterium]
MWIPTDQWFAMMATTAENAAHINQTGKQGESNELNFESYD